LLFIHAACSVSICDKPLTGTVDAGPDIVDVLRPLQITATMASTLRNFVFPETTRARCWHSV